MLPRVQMHANQLAVPVETVRKLVDEQFPEWRSLAIRSFPAHGTVNAIFRIGDQLTARFPLELRADAALAGGGSGGSPRAGRSYAVPHARAGCTG